MFQSQTAAEVLSAVVNQSCPFAAYGDGRNTVVAERLCNERIVAAVNGAIVGVYDRRQLENDRNVVDVVARVEVMIRAQNEKPADTDGQSADL